jgi:RimJ/RimL family protein N-acetyltransferase
MILGTTRLCLRPIAVSDAPALFAGRGDPAVMRYWDWPEQDSVGSVRAVLEAHIPRPDDASMLWWVAALTPDGPAIGECDLSEIDRHNRRAEVGFLFARAHWGKGYAQEAMARIVAYAFEDLDLERLWARFHAGNEASRRLLERLGFAQEGTLRGHVVRDGARRDCEVYGRLRNRSAMKNGA